MVFPGRLSTGCHTCRRRKVKCDGDKPDCRRCLQRGIQCAGFPDSFSFREYRPARLGTATGSLWIQRSPRPSSAGSRSDCSQVVPFTPEPVPSRALSVCADWQSVCNFMHQVVLKVHRSPCQGCLAFLPDFLKEKDDEPCLKHALLSVSQVILSNISGARELHIEARKNYGRSLEHLNKALGSREDAVKDEILASWLLLSMFFNCAHEGGGFPDPHVSGISHLLLLRGHGQARSKYSRDLIGWTIAQIQIQAIGTKKYQNIKISAYIQAMLNPDCVLRAGLLNSSIAEFCQSTSDMPEISVDSSPEEISRHARILKDLLKRASYLIEKIEIWNASIPPHWKKQYQFQNTDVAAVSAAPPPDPWTVTFLAITHTAQIVFYLPVLSCCKQIEKHDPGYSMPDFPGDIAEFCATVENQVVILLKTICYTVSFNIGFLDSNLTFHHPMSTVKFANSNTLLWPMWTVVNCPLASKEQIGLCRQALEYIGQAFGHKLALSLSNQAPGAQTSLPK